MSPSAIIIGSGPGGATAAEVLTRAGWSVVIMEKGRNHLLDPDDLTKPAGRLLQRRDQVHFRATSSAPTRSSSRGRSASRPTTASTPTSAR